MFLFGHVPPLKASSAGSAALTRFCRISSSGALCLFRAGTFFSPPNRRVGPSRGGYGDAQVHLKSHADITRTVLSTHIREECVKRCLTFPATLLLPRKTPVSSERAGPSYISAAPYQGPVRKNTARWTRKRFPSEILQRRRKKNLVDI